jgi:hypothetical protein
VAERPVELPPEIGTLVPKTSSVDLVTESLNVNDDGRAAMLLIDAASLAVQVETPT